MKWFFSGIRNEHVQAAKVFVVASVVLGSSLLSNIVTIIVGISGLLAFFSMLFVQRRNQLISLQDSNIINLQSEIDQLTRKNVELTSSNTTMQLEIQNLRYQVNDLIARIKNEG